MGIYPIQNNSLFLRGTGKLKNLKSPAQRKIPIQIGIVFVQTQSFRYRGKSRKNSKSPVQEKACKKQSLQYRGKFVTSQVPSTWENSLKKVSNTKENRKNLKFPMWLNSWKFKVLCIGGKFVKIQSTHGKPRKNPVHSS